MPWEVLSSSRCWERWGPVRPVPPPPDVVSGPGAACGVSPPHLPVRWGSQPGMEFCGTAMLGMALARHRGPVRGGDVAWGRGLGALGQARGLETSSGGGKEGPDPVPLLPAPPCCALGAVPAWGAALAPPSPVPTGAAPWRCRSELLRYQGTAPSRLPHGTRALKPQQPGFWRVFATLKGLACDEGS